MPSKLPKNQGQSLIDLLIATAIFIIIATAILNIVSTIYQTLIFSRNRLSSKYIAAEKMEIILSLPYQDLGTTAGIPHGLIPEFETVVRNGQKYLIHTTITYYDDPFDQTSPNDLLPTDYKQIRISVESSTQNEPVTLISNIAPKGIETSEGGGTLSILVINANAQPVTQAQVHITNTQITPNVDITLQTDINGRVILPGALPCPTCYFIEITKENYTSDRTYTEADLANPLQKPITISEGNLSEAVFVIDKVSQITILSYRNQDDFPPYPNATLRLTGTKIIGTNADGDPVYKYDQVFSTNGSGKYTIENGEWDNYILTIPSDQAYDLAAINPSVPISLIPNQDIEIKIALTSSTENSLLISLKDSSGSAIANVSAILRLDPDFIATDSSGTKDEPNFGQVFFNNLNPSTYEFTLTNPKYATNSGTISVNGHIQDEVILETND